MSNQNIRNRTIAQFTGDIKSLKAKLRQVGNIESDEYKRILSEISFNKKCLAIWKNTDKGTADE